MPTEEEIRLRTLRDLEAAAETCGRTKAEIEAERLVLIARIAAVSAAMTARDEAIAKSDAALAAARDRIQMQLDKDEKAALEKEGAEGKVAADLAEMEKQAADLACPVEKAEADRVYDQAYRAAGRLAGADADTARRVARAARDAAMDDADRKCERDKQAAFAKMNATFERLKAEHDVATNVALDKAAASREKAEERHRIAVKAAEAPLATLLANDPQVAAVTAGCDRRLDEAAARYEAACEAIMARQARELEELRRGGTS